MPLNTSLQIIGTEWIWIIFLVVFLLFGSQKLPELSRALGKAMGEFQRGRAEVEREIRAATAASYNNPPKVEQHDTIPIAATPLPAPSPAPAMTTPVTTTVTAAPTPVVTASTTTTTITTPEATSEKSGSTPEHPPKSRKTTKTRKSPAKTSRPRRKKDNSPAK